MDRKLVTQISNGSLSVRQQDQALEDATRASIIQLGTNLMHGLYESVQSVDRGVSQTFVLGGEMFELRILHLGKEQQIS